jgi:ribosomal protein S18 acetylase RimI-like enzyme
MVPVKMKIEPVSDKTIHQVASLEKCIEGDDAADLAVLISRQEMFPDGFLVAIENGEVVGYIESCLWDRNEFASAYLEYPKYHNANAKALYVIFLAAHPDHRGKGIGGRLVQSLQEVAKDMGKEKIILVARDKLLKFYGKLGFTIIKALPEFLSYTSCTHMEWIVEDPDTKVK